MTADQLTRLVGATLLIVSSVLWALAYGSHLLHRLSAARRREAIR